MGHPLTHDAQDHGELHWNQCVVDHHIVGNLFCDTYRTLLLAEVDRTRLVCRKAKDTYNAKKNKIRQNSQKIKYFADKMTNLLEKRKNASDDDIERVKHITV